MFAPGLYPYGRNAVVSVIDILCPGAELVGANSNFLKKGLTNWEICDILLVSRGEAYVTSTLGKGLCVPCTEGINLTLSLVDKTGG